MNQINLLGRLCSDPELRTTQGGTPVVTFTLAVDRRDKEKNTDFITCVAWKDRAQFISKHFTKGQGMALSGRLQIRDWTDKEGNKRRSAEVIADDVYFTESKKDRGERKGVDVPGPDFQELECEDGDLPF